MQAIEAIALVLSLTSHLRQSFVMNYIKKVELLSSVSFAWQVFLCELKILAFHSKFVSFLELIGLFDVL